MTLYTWLEIPGILLYRSYLFRCHVRPGSSALGSLNKAFIIVVILCGCQAKIPNLHLFITGKHYVRRLKEDNQSC